ncbi:vegetative cell wall protein gp1-like [Ischnura elegans]|uniref:vegetative cell wall protein gp1-like n=1 Tax=Ischnura elegans TaxID=197161 RepID=UPI001ED8827E|nr:vegetative cell wall protein gp1-like [Ischnura elegans]
MVRQLAKDKSQFGSQDRSVKGEVHAEQFLSSCPLLPPPLSASGPLPLQPPPAAPLRQLARAPTYPPLPTPHNGGRAPHEVRSPSGAAPRVFRWLQAACVPGPSTPPPSPLPHPFFPLPHPFFPLPHPHSPAPDTTPFVTTLAPPRHHRPTPPLPPPVMDTQSEKAPARAPPKRPAPGSNAPLLPHPTASPLQSGPRGQTVGFFVPDEGGRLSGRLRSMRAGRVRGKGFLSWGLGH